MGNNFAPLAMAEMNLEKYTEKFEKADKDLKAYKEMMNSEKNVPKKSTELFREEKENLKNVVNPKKDVVEKNTVKKDDYMR